MACFGEAFGVSSGPAPTPNLGRAATSGALWILFQTVSGRVVQVCAQFALAWLLLPSDFGKAAIAIGVFLIANPVITLGIDGFLSQRSHRVRFWLPTSLVVATFSGVAGAAIVIGASPAVSRAYGEDLTLFLLFVGASLPLVAISTMLAAALRVLLLFRAVAVVGFLELLLLQTLTVSLAWGGFGALSFAIPLPIVAAFKLALLSRHSPFRIDFSKRLRWQELIRSGLSLVGARICYALIGQGDYLILGLLASMSSLGNYFFAFNIAAQSSRTLGPSFGGTLTPTLARLRHEPKRQFDAAYRAKRLLGFVAVPLCFLQAGLAGPLLELLFGEKWLGSIILAQILSIALAFEAILWVTTALLHAQGRFFTILKLSAVQAGLFLSLVATGAALGEDVGAACGVLVCYFFFSPVYAFLAFRPGGYSFLRIWSIYIVPVGLSSLTIGGSAVLAGLLDGNSTRVLLSQCAIVFGVGLFSYFVALRFVAPSILSDVWRRLVDLTRRAQ